MPLHVLLVDDDEDEHLFFRWSLEKIDTPVTLTGAFSSAHAQRLLADIEPHIVFLDINLPGADGFECLESIKSIPVLKDVPVYMYSTEITEQTMQRAAALGATGCIKKSRSHDMLAKCIAEILKISHDERFRKNLQLK